jgi:hypothetical protein
MALAFVQAHNQPTAVFGLFDRFDDDMGLVNC